PSACRTRTRRSGRSKVRAPISGRPSRAARTRRSSAAQSIFGIRYSDSSCDIPPPDDAHPMRPARALSKRVPGRLRFGERLCNLPPEGLPGFRCLLAGKGGVREDELRFSARAFFDGRGELTPGLEVTSPVAALGRFAASGLLWG